MIPLTSPRFLIIVPTTLQGQWKNEWNRWVVQHCPDIALRMLIRLLMFHNQGTITTKQAKFEPEEDKPTCILTSWSVLSRCENGNPIDHGRIPEASVLLMDQFKPQTIVVDEASELTKTSSKLQFLFDLLERFKRDHVASLINKTA